LVDDSDNRNLFRLAWPNAASAKNPVTTSATKTIIGFVFMIYPSPTLSHKRARAICRPAFAARTIGTTETIGTTGTTGSIETTEPI
jgi:hypothetical protein